VANIKGRGGLGKGLSALIPQDTDTGEDIKEKSEIPISQISPNPFQPRREFDQEKLDELTESIKRHGVVQPVLLRKTGEDSYQLVAGERRFRAAKAAGLTEIPAIVKELSDREMMEIALIENIQRQDLNPVEEARAYKRLAEEFNLTQEQIAKRVAKSRSVIANSMRLLNLPAEILDYIVNEQLTPGHVRPLLTLPQEEAKKLAKIMVEQKATVREAESWAREYSEQKEEKKEAEDKKAQTRDIKEKDDQQIISGKEGKEKDLPVELKEIQRILRDTVQTKVEIQETQKGGKIIIEYYTQDDIERILDLITGSQINH